ncbi:MAG: hypothetical protein ACT6S0_04780 [Roseateles sp.]|uniref:hypothetical protein n=1 Tax=Roseateles sp. TaxID=1971397 RepID=UPI0040357E2D
MTCPDCTAAAQGPHYVYRANCAACQARDIAGGPLFFRCRQAGKQDKEYRALLKLRGVTHEAVVRASEAERTPA